MPTYFACLTPRNFEELLDKTATRSGNYLLPRCASYEGVVSQQTPSILNSASWGLGSDSASHTSAPRASEALTTGSTRGRAPGWRRKERLATSHLCLGFFSSCFSMRITPGMLLHLWQQLNPISSFPNTCGTSLIPPGPTTVPAPCLSGLRFNSEGPSPKFLTDSHLLSVFLAPGDGNIYWFALPHPVILLLSFLLPS